MVACEELLIPNEFQQGILLNYNLQPNKWFVVYETETTLVVVSHRRKIRRVLKKEKCS